MKGPHPWENPFGTNLNYLGSKLERKFSHTEFTILFISVYVSVTYQDQRLCRLTLDHYSETQFFYHLSAGYLVHLLCC